MAQFELTLKTDTLTPLLQALGASAPRALAQAIRRQGEMVMKEAKELVPVDTGNLRASGWVVPVGDRTHPQLNLSFGRKDSHRGPARYAWAVHENPRSGQTGGFSPSGRRYKHWARRGQWKYLEIPFKRHASRFTEDVAFYLRANWLETRGNVSDAVDSMMGGGAD